jgi:hypothetical protein
MRGIKSNTYIYCSDPLTPTLSRREREKSQGLVVGERDETAPLPEGQGSGVPNFK